MTTYAFKAKGDRLNIRKNGEHYASINHSPHTLTNAKTYRMLADRTKFEFWVVLALYYEAGAPETWVHDLSDEGRE